LLLEKFNRNYKLPANKILRLFCWSDQFLLAEGVTKTEVLFVAHN